MRSYIPRILNKFARTTRELVPKGLKRVSTGTKKSGPKEFKLLEKKTHCKMEEYSPHSWQWPEHAASFSRVKIGKNSDSSYFREILSFYDEDQKIVARFQKGSDINTTERYWKYRYDLTKDNHTVRVREISTRELTLDERIMGGLLSTWKDTAHEVQVIHADSKKARGAQVMIHKTLFNDRFDTWNMPASGFTSSIREYFAPVKKFFMTKRRAPKSLTVNVEREGNVLHVTDIKGSNISTNMPKDDPFLPYRFLTGTEKQEELTRYYIHEKGLDEAGIRISSNSGTVDDNAAAHFSSSCGEVAFKEICYNPAEVAAHEVEHAYQHKLIGQLGSGTTDYERKCRDLFGPIKNRNELNEALKCKDANDNYPQTAGIENLRQYAPYWENYLEVKAREAGEKASKLYHSLGSFWRKQFDLSIIDWL